jgi:cell division septum initiation protein DivIVA
MTNQTENFPDLMSDDSFEVVMRGYSRRQVHDYMIRTRNQIRDLEERLARTIDQAEQSRIELADARRKMTEAPQNPDELGERLSQILKLAHEEAAANKEASESEAARLRDNAAAEAERLVMMAREQAESIRAAAQEEAERRVADATVVAERLLSQAGSDAEETLGTARAEAEDTLRSARAEADRQLTTARLESERHVADANAEASAALAAAEQRVTVLDEHTGRRVVYLTDTHTEVMRRLNEIGSVLGDLLHREASAGPLIDEAAVVPPAPQFRQAQQTEQAEQPADDAPVQPEQPADDLADEPADGPAGHGDDHSDGRVEADVLDPAAGNEAGFDMFRPVRAVDHSIGDAHDDIRVIVDDVRHADPLAPAPMAVEVVEYTEVDFGRLRQSPDDQEPLHK